MSDFTGKIIKCRAAVSWGVNEDLKIEEVEVHPPQQNEVRVKIVASGVCFSDIAALIGKTPGNFPMIVGHEGAGIIESVGKGVSDLNPGDHVIFSFLPQCKICFTCQKPSGNFCMLGVGENSLKGLMPDGSSRFSCKGKEIRHFLGVSSFSEYTVAHVARCIKVDAKLPLEEICLMACGVPTGYGGAVNIGEVNPGSICAVFGLGTIGLAAVLGCKDAGASKIIAIDINADKFDLAKEFGATDCINPKELNVPVEDFLMQNFGGVDCAIECIGSIATMKQASESTTFANGTCVLLGISPAGVELPIDPLKLQFGRKIKGSLFGGYRCRDDIPKLVESHEKLKLKKFITHKMPLDKINEAIELLKAGKSIRTVITF